MAGRISELDPITGAALTLADDIEVRDIDDPEMSPLTGTNHALPLGELILFLQMHMADAGLVVDDVPPTDTSVLWADTTEEGSSANTVRAGTVAPTAGDGNDGDFWINTATWFIYGPKSAGAWPTGVSMTGGGGGGGITEAAADARYVNLDGDTMTGTLTATELYASMLDADGTIVDGNSVSSGGQGFFDGGVTVAVDPTSDNQLTRKSYVNGLLANKQSLDADLTAIAALAPADNTVMQRKAGVWVASTPATVKTDLAIASGDVSGLGALATLSAVGSTQITDGQVGNAELATMPANTIKMNNTAGVASPTDVTVANAQTALAIPALPVTVANGGTGRNTATTAYGLLAAGTTATGIQQTVTPAASGFLKTTSTTALPAWAAIANTDVSGLGTLSTKSTIATADITDDQVTNAKLANAAANSFKGNNTGSAADPIDMTVAQAKTLLAIASGDVSGLGALATATVPITVAQGGSGRATATTAYGLIAAGTTATGNQQTVTPAASGFLKTTSATALPAWTAITGADIANDSVTNTQLALMPTLTIKGNNSGSTAGPLDLTVAQLKTMLGINEITVASTAPSSPATNDLWVDTT